MTDYKLVPLEPTPEMVSAAEDAYMPFGDMELALRMAILSAPAVQGEPTGQRCEYCDGTGDVHSIDGEWRGVCDCQQPAEQQPSVQKPVGFVSQDFLEGKWSLDHIAKSDEGQISRTIPAFAKPPQPAPDVSALVEALERVMYCNEVKFLPEGVQQAVSDALAAHHIKENGNG